MKKLLTVLICFLLLAISTSCADLDRTLDHAVEVGNEALENACSEISEKIRSSKVPCTLNIENATQIIYKDTKYQILNTTLNKDDAVAKWTGVILRFAALDSRNRVLAQQNISDEQITNDSVLHRFEINLPQNTRFIIPFYDVYKVKNADENEMIAVLVGKHFYKAIPIKSKTPNDKIFKPENEDIWVNGNGKTF